MKKQVYTGNKVVNIHTDVICYTPFSGPFKGTAINQVIPTGSIKYLLGRGATVEEVLSNGTTVKLGPDNYNIWLDEGRMPSPGHEPVVPQERVEVEEEERTIADPATQESAREEEPEPIIEPAESEDIEVGEEDIVSESSEDEEDVLNNIPDGLTEEEEDQWLEDNLE